jgi:hypothetical protein
MSGGVGTLLQVGVQITPQFLGSSYVIPPKMGTVGIALEEMLLDHVAEAGRGDVTHYIPRDEVHCTPQIIAYTGSDVNSCSVTYQGWFVLTEF